MPPLNCERGRHYGHCGSTIAVKAYKTPFLRYLPERWEKEAELRASRIDARKATISVIARGLKAKDTNDKRLSK